MSAKHTLLALLGLVCLALPVDQAHAFCGFYIAKADTELFNEASKVVIVRHDRKTVITMVNDYKGDPKEFAIVWGTATSARLPAISGRSSNPILWRSAGRTRSDGLKVRATVNPTPVQARVGRKVKVAPAANDGCRPETP